MRRIERIGLVVCLLSVLVLTGCAGGRPIPPQPPELPLVREVDGVRRMYLPLLTQPEWRKKGVGVANGQCVSGLGLGWHYDWSSQPIECDGSAAIPMVWGMEEPMLAPSYDGIVFALNEPDRADQSNLSPTAGAVRWRELEARLPRARLVGPAVSHAGREWLWAWREAYEDLYEQAPRIWALNVHCYMEAKSCQDWIEYNGDLAQEWTASGRVWLTEWAVLPCWYAEDGVRRAQAQADQLLPWLESNPTVAGYAWFGSYVAVDPPAGFGAKCDTSLVDASGGLTTWGTWYATDHIH